MSAGLKIKAWRDLFKKYRDHFAHYWKIRKQISLPDFKADEAEFLPSIVSIQAKPVSPTGRWTARIMLLFLFFVIIWSIFGRMDIVVNAPGKVIPSGYTKTLSSVETGRVSALYVLEGQSVKKGDLLVELDTRLNDADGHKSGVDKDAAWLQVARSEALIHAINSDKPPSPILTKKLIDSASLKFANDQVYGQWLDYSSKRRRLDDEIKQLDRSLELATQRAKDYADLAKTRDVSQHTWSEKEQAVNDIRGQLNGARNQRTMLHAETKKTAQDASSDANRVILNSNYDLQKARVKEDLLKIVAPIDGTVQQLTAHTVGGVVPSAQPLMQLVPHQAKIEIEAQIESKDIGFIYEGQDAKVKIDAFEYSKYGTLNGKVEHISKDSFEDDKKKSFYKAKITLTERVISIDNKPRTLSPGMTANIEIKTGDRRIIEYFLSPLIRYSKETINER